MIKQGQESTTNGQEVTNVSPYLYGHEYTGFTGTWPYDYKFNLGVIANMQNYKPFDVNKDYFADIAPEDIKEDDKGNKFVYLRGLEKLAKARGIKKTSSHIMAVEWLSGIICTYTYEFMDGCEYQGSADATEDNLKGVVLPYKTAMAESRAKARCLRSAFSIANCSVEELVPTENILVSGAGDFNRIGDEQIITAELLSAKAGLELLTVAKKALAVAQDIKDIRTLTREQGTILVTFLNKCIEEQRDKAKKTNGSRTA